jgi:hypothetical protein
MLSRRSFVWRASVIAAGGLTAPSLAAAAASVEVKFDDLYERETVLTERLKDLAGEIVEMSGYMAPPLKAEAKFFVLTRSPMAVCPFCETEMQWPDDIVLVLTDEMLAATPYNVRIRVRGQLDLGFEKDPETGFVSLIRIESAEVERA